MELGLAIFGGIVLVALAVFGLTVIIVALTDRL